jgi:hypothetical protein
VGYVDLFADSLKVECWESVVKILSGRDMPVLVACMTPLLNTGAIINYLGDKKLKVFSKRLQIQTQNSMQTC